MADVSFFMTDSDTLDFARFLVGEFECRFTMDGAAQPELPELTVPEEIAAKLDPDGYRPRFFVTSARWSGFPLLVHKTNHHDGRVRWYVEQRYGGPAFDYTVSKPKEVDGSLQIAPGWFSDYPYYYIRRSDATTVERPAQMAAAFQAVRRYLRRTGVRTRHPRVAKPGPWVLPGAYRAFEQGCWLREGDWRFEPEGQLTNG
jgi:hypothetical protein